MTEVQATAGTDITPLLRPLRIGQLELKNRFVMPGMQRAWCVDGAPDERLREYYRRRALGGTALVVCEACAVDHPSAASNPMFARLDARTTGAWRACVEGVHAAGGRIFIQLWHQGAVDTGKAGPDFTALSPSGLEKAGKPFGRPARAQELAEIIDAFARCAVIARDIGADGVEVHACHGYLLDQFLWAETNQRADQYGGPGIAGRAAFPAAVVAAVRAAVGPDYPVAVRISQWKEADYEAKVAASPAELAELVAILRAAGTDLFHVSTRRFWTPEWPGSDLGLAGWVKSFTDAPVIAVGSVGLDIDVMATLTGEEARPTGPGRIDDLVRRFERGDFDLISIGRSLIGDPDWVAKMRDGRGAEIRPFRRTDLQWLSLSGPRGGRASSLRGVHRFRFVLISELTKIRSVRSMSLALLLTPAVCAGLGYAVSLSLRLSFPRLPAQQRHDWDPLFATFYGLSIGQLALVVFGVNVTGSEYPTRAIMSSLAAVPRRGRFYAAKVAAGLLAAAGSAVVAVAATFLAAQAALGPLGARAGAPGTLRAALGACLYLTLISALAMGVAAITRSPALSLVVLTPLLFLDSQGLGNVPGLQRVIDYLPDQAGAVIAHLSGAGAGQFGRPYGPWTGVGIMAAWAAAALIGGYLVLARTDAAGEPGPRGPRGPRGPGWLLAKDRTPPLQNGCG